MRLRQFTWAMGVAAAITSPAALHAASVTAVLYNIGDTPAGVSPGTDSLTVNFGQGDNANTFAGQINWHSAESPDWTAGLNAQLLGQLGPNGTFSTYCIEGTQNVYFGNIETWSLGVVPLAGTPYPGLGMGDVKAGELTEFWDRYHDMVGTDPIRGTAFQLGVWEIVNDGLTADPFSTGTLTASGSVPGDAFSLNLAAEWLSAVGGPTPYTADYTLYALSDGGIQDQIFAVRTTPLPGALPASAMALGVLGAWGAAGRRRALKAARVTLG
ncbi:MAG TPA: hypothetical protein VHQ47_02765 [Phycisphaerae bacterium]|nr:hypothetical protein [Phycisphaerae bacterium]